MEHVLTDRSDEVMRFNPEALREKIDTLGITRFGRCIAEELVRNILHAKQSYQE